MRQRKTIKQDRTGIDSCDNCGNAFHKEEIDPPHVKAINNKLLNNRLILEAVITPIISKSELLEKGFDFDYHTESYTTLENEVYYGVYEYGYKILAENLYEMVKREMPEMD